MGGIFKELFKGIYCNIFRTTNLVFDRMFDGIIKAIYYNKYNLNNLN